MSKRAAAPVEVVALRPRAVKWAALLLLFLCSSSRNLIASAGDSSSSTAVQVLSKVCDPRGIPSGSTFPGHLGFLLEELVQNTPFIPDYSFKTRIGGGDSPAFGQACCQPSCSPARCQACLHQLSNDIWSICNNALGARVEYPDCWIHYECFYF